MLGLRLPELLVILVVVVVMFGSKKIPELGDSLGKGIRAFKKAVEHGLDEEDSRDASKGHAQQAELPQGSATTKASPSPAEKKV